MYSEFWTEEKTKSWSAYLGIVRNFERTLRTIGWFHGYAAALLPLCAMWSVLTTPDAWIAPTVYLLICWMGYSCYLEVHRKEVLWRTIIHHGQRMLNETDERREWHYQQIRNLFDVYDNLLN